MSSPLAAQTAEAPPLARWIASVGLGDQSALRRLYEATSPKLFAVALRIVRNEARAEDVLQDSFMNVWNGARAYDPALSAPMTWLITIVRNRALDYLRRADRAIELDDAIAETLESEAAGPAELAMLEQQSGTLDVCMRRLDAGQRQAIAFAYFQGLSHSELATALRIPIGTVKTWIRRGLEKLRRCLDGEAGARN
jgi:RNA polymerase sigma-70 factor (ECF subfamily)